MLRPLQLALLAWTCLGASLSLGAQCPAPVWSDEFDGATLDLTKWSHDVNTDCGAPPCSWYNNELQQYYPENTKLENGELVITATKAPAGARWAYNSSRIITQGKFETTYGHIEARVKVPSGKGTWPAFWLLSDQQRFGPWPLSGEIDILEWVGNKPKEVLGTIHYGNTPGQSIYSSAVYKPGGRPVADEWHTYAIEWNADQISWFYDGYRFFTRTRADIAPHAWPFTHDFFIILNLAVGGTLGGSVDPRDFPAEMRVDYVRVYKAGKPYLTGPFEVPRPNAEATYRVGNVASGTAIAWTVPAGATIVSGQGTPNVTVRFGTEGGRVSAKPANTCITDEELAVTVFVPAAKQRERSLENFDDDSPLTYEFATGTLTEVANPAPADPNSSALVGRYQRNSGSQYDVLIYKTNAALTNVAPFVTEDKAFFIDLYTNAPVGTEILLQLETAAATGGNFPTGRHSRYSTRVERQGAWQRLPFKFVDRPDGSASSSGIKQLVILFASNSTNGSTYTFDNLDVYGAAPTGIIEGVAPVGALRLSPNPATSTLQLDLLLDEPQALTLEVVDVVGRVLRRLAPKPYPVGASREAIDVTDLPGGTYRLVLRGGDRQSSLSFVKE